MPRMLCWVVKHDSHGLVYEKPIWLPEGDKPEVPPESVHGYSRGQWERVPWLDQTLPVVRDKPIPVVRDK